MAQPQALLVKRFETVRHQPGGWVGLLRIEPDRCGITLLAQAPL